MEEHPAGHPDGQVDDRPLGRRGWTDVGRDLAPMQDGQDEAERHDRDQRVDPGGELKDGQDGRAHAGPVRPARRPPPES